MRWIAGILAASALSACGEAPLPSVAPAERSAEGSPAASAEASARNLLSRQPTTALAADGQYISWREHRIDDELLTVFIDAKIYEKTKKEPTEDARATDARATGAPTGAEPRRRVG